MAIAELRVQSGVAFAPVEQPKPSAARAEPFKRGDKVVRVLRLHGTILPRAGMMSALSGAASLEQFQAAFREAAEDPSTAALIIDIDSPGGQVDLVPETVALIRSYKNADRPIIAISNTLAASAAYWIAIAADELVVTPSGSVGSIGVYMMHTDMSEKLKAEGVSRTFIHEGPRKVEGNPFEPLGPEAKAALQAEVRTFYEMFTSDVAKARNVSVSVVRADPEKSDTHFGGGRVYPAKQAVKLGMADRVATLEETINRAARGGPNRRASTQRMRQALT